MKSQIIMAFTTASIMSASAATGVTYDVGVTSSYPAEGESIAELERVCLSLKRGFGAVGYNPAADGTNVWIENEAGDKIMLVNAAGQTPSIDDNWRLAPLPGNNTPGVLAFKDRLYDALFTRTLGWNGGDGVFTVGLPDGHTFWTFNDSFYGVADGATRARGACSFPRNTVMTQKADDQGYPVTSDEELIWLADFVNTSRPSDPGYYKALTHIDHPLAQSFNDDKIAQDFLYWSGDGTVVDGHLQMLWNGVDNRNGEMLPLGTALATYSLEGKPGDKSYLALESVDHDFMPSNPYAYGSTLWEDPDGHIYLYSSTGNGQWLGNVPIVARTASASLDSEWEYYVADSQGRFAWQKEYPSKEQVQRSSIVSASGSFTLPWVFKKGDSYFMCAQTFPFGQEMVIMRSDNPWGPFTDKKTLISFPNPLDELQHDRYGDKYRFLYMLNLHPALSRNGELVISTNTDATDDGPGSFWRYFNEPGSCDWYRPFFFRVYGWENLFPGTMAGLTDRIEFVAADKSATIAPGKYRFVCEQGVFGDETFETQGFNSGRANQRIEIEFTVGSGAGSGIDDITISPDAARAEPAAIYNMQGIRVENPVAGSVYIEVRGNKASKIIAR